MYCLRAWLTATSYDVSRTFGLDGRVGAWKTPMSTGKGQEITEWHTDCDARFCAVL